MKLSGKMSTFDNIKCNQKSGLYLLSRKDNFEKITGIGGHIDPRAFLGLINTLKLFR